MTVCHILTPSFCHPVKENVRFSASVLALHIVVPILPASDVYYPLYVPNLTIVRVCELGVECRMLPQRDVRHKLHLCFLAGLLHPLRKSVDTPPTLGQLCAELNDFNNWYRLGLQLNVSKNILDSIDKLHDTKVGKCIEMIQHWISNSYNPSWEIVHEALWNTGESVLAAKIAQKYHVQSSRIGGEVSSVPDPEHSGSSE